MTAPELQSLLRTLQFHPDDEWLRLVYENQAAPIAHAHVPVLSSFDGEESSSSSSSSAAASALASPLPAVLALSDMEDTIMEEEQKSTFKPSFSSSSSSPPPSSSPSLAAQRQAQAQRNSLVPTLLRRLKLLTNSVGLHENVDLYTSFIHALYRQGRHRHALSLSTQLLAIDAFHPTLLKYHILLLYALKLKSDLFYLSSSLTHAIPSSSLSWLAVASFYAVTGKHDSARKHFSHASSLSPLLLESWLGFATCYSAQEESEQAMIAYRTCMRLFEGSYEPLLGAGIESIRAGNSFMGFTLLTQATRVSPCDPLTWHELGVARYKQEEYREAITSFTRALALLETNSTVDADHVSEIASIAWMNLAHAYRKLEMFPLAIRAYQRALGAIDRASESAGGAFAEQPSVNAAAAAASKPVSGSAVAKMPSLHRSLSTALGFTYHLSGDLDRAIRCYHEALASAPRDTLTQDLLNRSIQEATEAGSSYLLL